uniref:Uncharacterized protein n=1 Tax=Nelumbo nucifera TaxID=4432 RepID=A0A822YCC1_NELNU|nr:TPA_asm: hypothetical protein HUJ06_031575 [Nelumbo nucifera]
MNFITKYNAMPNAVSEALSTKTIFFEIAITKRRNPVGTKHIRITTGIPPGTLYGLFSVGYFRLSQIKDAISSSIPKLYRKFADAIILVKSMNDTPSVIALETKIPTQGVLNQVDRAAQNRGKKPRSPIPRNWKEELLNWASKSPIADRTTPISTQNFNHFPAIIPAASAKNPSAQLDFSKGRAPVADKRGSK